MNAKRTIFIVEDESHIQELIKYNLEAVGYGVSGFLSGEEMLSHCESIIPDMFILDLMLPGIDGYEILKEIRRNQQLRLLPE